MVGIRAGFGHYSDPYRQQPGGWVGAPSRPMPQCLMRAITPVDGRPAVVEMPVPKPGPAEVRIRVAAAGVNRADLLQTSAHYRLPEGFTEVLGLECAGTVDAVGAGVDASLVGRPVSALLDGGGYAEFAVAPVTQIRILPDDADLTVSGARPEALCTAWYNLVQLAGLQRGERVLIHGGSGGVGHIAVQLGRLLGATVLTTVGSDAKAARAVELGAHHAIRYDGDVPAAVADLTGGKGVDVILDLLGAGGLAGNISMLATGGRLAIIGLQRGRKGEIDLSEMLYRKLTVMGSTLRARTAAEKSAIVSGATEFSDRVTTVVHAAVPFEEPERAHAIMNEDATFGKVVLTFS